MDEDLELAELLIRRNVTDQETLQACMREKALGSKSLGEILVDKGFLSPSRLGEFLEEIRSSPASEPDIVTYYCHKCGAQYRARPKPGVNYFCKQCSNVLSDAPANGQEPKPTPTDPPKSPRKTARIVSTTILDEIADTLNQLDSNASAQARRPETPRVKSPPARPAPTTPPPTANPARVTQTLKRLEAQPVPQTHPPEAPPSVRSTTRLVSKAPPPSANPPTTKRQIRPDAPPPKASPPQPEYLKTGIILYQPGMPLPSGGAEPSRSAKSPSETRLKASSSPLSRKTQWVLAAVLIAFPALVGGASLYWRAAGFGRERDRQEMIREVPAKRSESKAPVDEPLPATKRGAAGEVRNVRERTDPLGVAPPAERMDKAPYEADRIELEKELRRLMEAEEFVKAGDLLHRAQERWSLGEWKAFVAGKAEQVRSTLAMQYAASQRDALKAFGREDDHAVAMIRERVTKWNLLPELDKALLNAAMGGVEAKVSGMIAEERFGAALGELGRVIGRLNSAEWAKYLSGKTESIKKAAKDRFRAIKVLAQVAETEEAVRALRERVVRWQVEASVADPAELHKPQTPARPASAIALEVNKARLVGTARVSAGGVSLSPGDAAEWTTAVAEGGRFTIEIRASCGAREGGPFLVTLGAARLTGFARLTEGSPEVLSLGPAVLPKGALAISIRPLNSAVTLSSVTLARSDSALGREDSAALLTKAMDEFDAGRYGPAAGILKRIYEGSPDAEAVTRAAYKLACLSSLQDDQASALEWLEAAAALGIGSVKDGVCHATMWAHLKADPALAPIRDHPRFAELIKRYNP